MKQAGFTLIELLVVVLIIGILTAVALPQYQKAVEKSRIVEAKIALKTLKNAVELRGLATGSHSLEIDDLDISIGSLTGRYFVTKNFRVYIDEFACRLNSGDPVWACGTYMADRIGGDYSVLLHAPRYDITAHTERFICDAGANSNTVCPKIGAVKENNVWLLN